MSERGYRKPIQVDDLDLQGIAQSLDFLGIPEDGIVGVSIGQNGVSVMIAMNGALSDEEFLVDEEEDDFEDDNYDSLEVARADMVEFFDTANNLIKVRKTDCRSFVVASVDMFKESSLNEFAHGYDTFVPVAALAVKIMDKDDRIDEITEIKWLKPITNKLNVTVYEEDRPIPGKTDENASYKGKFKTRKGREFKFFAVQTNEEIDNYLSASVNYESAPVLGGDVQDDVYSMNFDEIPEELHSLDSHDEAYVSRALMQLMTKMLKPIIGDAALKESYSGGARLLFCGFKGLKIPQDLSSVFCEGSELQMRILLDDRKVGKSGYELWPIEYKFHFQEDWQETMIAMKCDKF